MNADQGCLKSEDFVKFKNTQKLMADANYPLQN